jgi:hypothetical protein
MIPIAMGDEGAFRQAQRRINLLFFVVRQAHRDEPSKSDSMN